MMKNIFLVLAFTCSFLFAESVKISNLPVVLPANVTTSDVFPVVNYPSVVTGKLKVSELFSVPSLAAPSFTGVVSISNGSAAAPALTFASDTDTGLYRAGANQLGISSGGRQILYLEDNSGPGVVLNPDATNLSSYFYQSLNTAMLSLSGGSGSASGASERLYGGTHATKASLHEFYVNSTLVGSHNASGLWTLGTSGGSQFHIANGQLLVNGAATSDYTLKVVRGTAGITNGSATVVVQDVTTNTTAKVAAIGLGRYDNSNKDNALIYASNNATTATMSLGGGVSNLHAVTTINFYTAANSSTNTGNLVGSINTSGAWALGASSTTPVHRINGATQSTVGAAGAASALPATPTGYLELNLNGTAYVLPYYTKS